MKMKRARRLYVEPGDVFLKSKTGLGAEVMMANDSPVRRRIVEYLKREMGPAFAARYEGSAFVFIRDREMHFARPDGTVTRVTPAIPEELFEIPKSKLRARIITAEGDSKAVAEALRAAGIGVEIDREVDGRYIADVTSVPGAMAYGKTPADAAANAIRIAKETLADRPAASRARTAPEESISAGVSPEPQNMVDHPPHYGGSDDPYEAIKVIEAWGATFNIGTALKYLRRHGRKDGVSEVQDLKKAVFYIQREIGLLTGVRPAEVVRQAALEHEGLVAENREMRAELEPHRRTAAERRVLELMGEAIAKDIDAALIDMSRRGIRKPARKSAKRAR